MNVAPDGNGIVFTLGCVNSLRVIQLCSACMFVEVSWRQHSMLVFALVHTTDMLVDMLPKVDKRSSIQQFYDMVSLL